MKKLLLFTIFLMISFLALAQLPPSNLAATVVDGNDVNLAWGAPSELVEIAYDDGVNEGSLMVENPQYVALRLTMPEDGTVHEVALYLGCPFGSNVYDLNDIIICPDDGTGLPDVTTPYENLGAMTVDHADFQWKNLILTSPIMLTSGEDFWVLVQWPTGDVFPNSVQLAKDNTLPPAEDRNYFTTTSGEWILYDRNLMIRAYYAASTSKNYITKSQQTPTNSNGINDLLGYNVYRDEVLVEYSTVTTYSDLDLPDNTYDYHITAVYDEGESTQSNTVTVTINTAGVNENFIHNTIIHPNPANDVVNVKSDLQITSISVYSLTGQIVANEFVQSDAYQFNTSNLKSGFYIFRIETAKGTINHSVIID